MAVQDSYIPAVVVGGAYAMLGVADEDRPEPGPGEYAASPVDGCLTPEAPLSAPRHAVVRA